MKVSSILKCAGLFVACIPFFAANSSAQRIQGAKTQPQPGAYDASRDVSIVGTVAKYLANSAASPAGAHVFLQTASGTIDVHLGDSRLLTQQNFTITEGSTLRIIGQPLNSEPGSIFLARIVQQGTQAIAVRTSRGMLLWPARGRVNPVAQSAAKQGGVL